MPAGAAMAPAPGSHRAVGSSGGVEWWAACCAGCVGFIGAILMYPIANPDKVHRLVEGSQNGGIRPRRATRAAVRDVGAG